MIPLPLLSRIDLGSSSFSSEGCRLGESDAFEDCWVRFIRRLQRALGAGAGPGPH